MADNPLISVIVPVYKVEPYLRKCVDSILAQTYPNLEIILVDDGSPDNCPAICDEYAAKDSRVKVIHKPNGGLSSARNAGLDTCSGDYIGFVDSDDYISPEMYETLLRIITYSSADLAVCEFDSVDESYQVLENKYPSPIKDEVLSRDDALAKLVVPFSWRFIVAWNKLYSRNLFFNCRFPDGKISEDGYVAHHLIFGCDKVAITSKKLYYYLSRGNSITGLGQPAKKLDGMWGKYDQYKFFLDHSYTDYAVKSWRQLYADLYSALSNMPYLPNRKEFNLAIRKIMFVKPNLRVFRILLLLAKKIVTEAIT